LLCRDTVHCFHVLAGEPPRALPPHVASCPAEAALISVSHADIFSPVCGLAFGGGVAGPAEVRHGRDTDEDRVRSSARDLSAFPARRAFLLAQDGADAFAHVLHAPARAALLVELALRKEAPLAWGASGHFVRCELRIESDCPLGQVGVASSQFSRLGIQLVGPRV